MSLERTLVACDESCVKLCESKTTDENHHLLALNVYLRLAVLKTSCDMMLLLKSWYYWWGGNPTKQQLIETESMF